MKKFDIVLRDVTEAEARHIVGTGSVTSKRCNDIHQALINAEGDNRALNLLKYEWDEKSPSPAVKVYEGRKLLGVARWYATKSAQFWQIHIQEIKRDIRRTTLDRLKKGLQDYVNAKIHNAEQGD